MKSILLIIVIVAMVSYCIPNNLTMPVIDLNKDLIWNGIKYGMSPSAVEDSLKVYNFREVRELTKVYTPAGNNKGIINKFKNLVGPGIIEYDGYQFNCHLKYNFRYYNDDIHHDVVRCIESKYPLQFYGYENDDYIVFLRFVDGNLASYTIKPKFIMPSWRIASMLEDSFGGEKRLFQIVSSNYRYHVSFDGSDRQITIADSEYLRKLEYNCTPL